MRSVQVVIFQSCSRHKADAEVNAFFKAIAEALDMTCITVDTAHHKNPSELAREYLNDAWALMAIGVKRTKLADGKYSIPEAVGAEIAYAVGKELPVLIFTEEGVELSGFSVGYAAHYSFTRESLYTPQFLQHAVKALHDLKMSIVSSEDLVIGQQIREFYAEHINHLVELKEVQDGYTWSYSSSKKIVFTKPFKKCFSTGVWAVLPADAGEDEPPIRWSLKVDSSSRSIAIRPLISKHSAECVEASLKLDPPAEPGDHVEYSTTWESRHLNAVWMEDVLDDTKLHLEGGDFRCADGIIPTQTTKKAIIEFRFPRSYGLSANDIHPFVASYTSGIDYEVESEIERMQIKVESFAGNLLVRLEIDSPLIRHMYGIAWNPRFRPGTSSAIATPSQPHAQTPPPATPATP